MNIQGKEYPVSSIFSNLFAFEIPFYQRPYLWTTEHAGELLDDLITAVGEDTQTLAVDMPPYFLGCIVVIKSEGQSEAVVVDGQQRLTTLTILISALRQTLDGEKSASLTEFLYEQGSLVLSTPNRYRLKARPSDQDLFHSYVQQQGNLCSLAQLDAAQMTDSQSNIRGNARGCCDIV